MKVTKDSDIESTLVTSYYNKPSQVTLNYGEKRMLIIGKPSEFKNIVFKINDKGNTANKQYKINIYVVKGNDIFKYQNEK